MAHDDNEEKARQVQAGKARERISPEEASGATRAEERVMSGVPEDGSRPTPEEALKPIALYLRQSLFELAARVEAEGSLVPVDSGRLLAHLANTRRTALIPDDRAGLHPEGAERLASESGTAK
jgi:hypothetical protein